MAKEPRTSYWKYHKKLTELARPGVSGQGTSNVRVDLAQITNTSGWTRHRKSHSTGTSGRTWPRNFENSVGCVTENLHNLHVRVDLSKKPPGPGGGATGTSQNSHVRMDVAQEPRTSYWKYHKKLTELARPGVSGQGTSNVRMDCSKNINTSGWTCQRKLTVLARSG